MMNISIPTGLLVLLMLMTALGLFLDLRLIVTGKWQPLDRLWGARKPVNSRDARIYGVSSLLPLIGMLVALGILIARPPLWLAILGFMMRMYGCRPNPWSFSEAEDNRITNTSELFRSPIVTSVASRRSLWKPRPEHQRIQRDECLSIFGSELAQHRPDGLLDRSRNDRIELRIGPALDTLRGLPDGEHVDFAFVDANKQECWEYFGAILSRLRPGGIIAFDNVFRHGDVVDTRRNAAAAAGTRM